jgi:hypothetical protein
MTPKLYFSKAAPDFGMTARNLLSAGDAQRVMGIFRDFAIPLHEYHKAFEHLKNGCCFGGPLDAKGVAKVEKEIGKIASPRSSAEREKAIKILAKSIYKELREQGYDPKQIIGLATEIIGCVTTDIASTPPEGK